MVAALGKGDDKRLARYYDQLHDHCENLDHDSPLAWEALATWTMEPRASLRYFKIALKQFRKLNDPNDPSLPDVLFHVGRLALETGDLKSAQKHLAEAQQEALRQHKVYAGGRHAEDMLKLERRIADLLLRIHLSNR